MRYMRSRALYSAQTTVFPRKMLVITLEALYAAAELVFITPRSAVRSCPPLPILSTTYGGQRDWPFVVCVQFVSTNLRIKHYRLNGGSFVSLSGSDIAGGGLNLGVAHQCRNGEGVKARLAQPRTEGGAQIMPNK